MLLLKHLTTFATIAVFIGLTSCGDQAVNSPARRAMASTPAGAAKYPVSTHIVVDQFGYRPDDAKVAVIRSAEVGYDAADKFTPGAIYDVRRADTGQIAMSGILTAWKGGETDPSAGDKGWWFDFSTVTEPGSYFVSDAQHGVRSAVFRVDSHVYKNVLKAAMRMYFYQRSGFKKQPPFAEECWADEAAYLGKGQDTEARDITDPENTAKVRDLSGGWFDAGDTNKYVTFAVPVVHQLLTAYEEYPEAFTDDFNIPESGNGIPDVLDEIKWETDWFKKMQGRDGGVALKVGEIAYKRASPPSSDHTARYYVPSCTSSTIGAAGVFAHAAYDYGKFPALKREADELTIRAKAAWHAFNQKPHELHCDANIVHAGNADKDATDQDAESVVAAVYLFAVTSDPTFSDYVKSHYRTTRPYRDMGWSRYDPDQGDALLFYTSLPQADAELKRTVLADKRANAESGNGVYGFDPDADLYRAKLHEEQYHWGSNQLRANYGNVNLDVLAYDVGIVDRAPFSTRALETLHYFHGVNPFGMVYLSNMYSYGASYSANEIFHTWYGRYSSGLDSKADHLLHMLRLDRVAALPSLLDFKSKWNDARSSSCGPAPGYVPGGPNRDALVNGVPATLRPPVGQPLQKTYRDWNVDWPDHAWAITEPGIYYQSSYVKLVAAFAR